MADTFHDDILVPGDERTEARGRQVPAAAFVPIGVALLGVAAIMFGGISARTLPAANNVAIDQMITGSTSGTEQGEANHAGVVK
jgi:hypothetical protein